MFSLHRLAFRLISLGQPKELEFDRMVDSLTSKTIPFIQPDRLDKLIESSDSFFLLDTREPDEFATSHIRGSLNVGYKTLDKKRLYTLPKTQTIVVYCSLGARSENVGEKLKERGYQEVYNLYGGIFNWVNLGFPIVDSDGNVTRKIHVYSKRWGKLLFQGEKTCA